MPTSSGHTSRPHFPGAVGLFRDIDSAISLRFLARFECQDRADRLTVNRLAAWLKSVGYFGRKDPADLYTRLTSAPRGATGHDGTAKTYITRTFVTLLGNINDQIRDLEEQISEQLAVHVDAHIFTSQRVLNQPHAP